MVDPTSPPDTPDATTLSSKACWELIRDQPYGRLAVVGVDGADIFPINALVDHGTVVFRTAAGAKLDAIANDPRVAFEVDGYDATSRTAWSVIIRGTARRVTDVHEGVDVVELGVTPWQHGPKPEFVRLEPTSVAGRRFERTDREEWSIGDVHRTTAID